MSKIPPKDINGIFLFNHLHLGAQDITQVMTSQGMVSSTNGQHEIMLTINNSSLSQVLAHASGSATAASSGSPQEITLTISGLCF